MSYDVYLNVDAGAGYSVCAFDRNMTSNVAPMWREAGVDLREFEGMLAWRVVDSLSAAIDNMTKLPRRLPGDGAIQRLGGLRGLASSSSLRSATPARSTRALRSG